MRIAISGTGNQGKTTLINDFLQEWSNYETESKTYRTKLVEEKLPHSKHTTKDTQWKILNHMVDEMQTFNPEDNVVMDRCPIDNLVYSLWCLEKGVGDIDEDFISKCIPIVCESMKHLDIIFFLPMTKFNDIKIEEDGVRETDLNYIKEVDHIFKAIQAQYHQHPQDNPFFPRDDSPALIEIFGSRHERLEMLKLYLDVDGDVIEGDQSELFNPENLNLMEELLKQQSEANDNDKALKEQLEQIKEFNKTNNLKIES